MWMCRWLALITCEQTNNNEKRTQKFARTGSCKAEKWTSYNGNALKHSLFQFVNTSFDRLWVIDFSWFPQISLVSFGRPWITTLLKSIKLIHIRQYFVITDFDPFFKLTNRFLSSNIHFIDLSISFSMIDFERFVMPCWNPLVTKTWNDLKPPKTIYNQLQPPQKIQ